MVVRTTNQLATIMAIRESADERNATNGHSLPLSELPELSARNWQTRVHIALRELGFTDRHAAARGKRLDFLSELFGRQVTSVKDLSWPECQSLCFAISIPITKHDLETISNEYR